MTTDLPVMLITEGTYPYQEGGVSTWCDALIRHLPEVPFVITSMTGQPETAPAYALPANIVGLINMPLWGTLGASEIRRDMGWFGLGRLRSRACQPDTIARFGELFAKLIADLLDEETHVWRLAETIRNLAYLFATSDYDVLMRHAVAWEIFSDTIIRQYARGSGGRSRVAHERAVGAPLIAGSEQGPGDQPMPAASLRDTTEALQMLTRWLTPLALPLPPCRIIHATSAGLASLPAIVARVERGTPFLLTEHGVYLRERLIAWAASDAAPLIKWFAARVTRHIVELSFAMADTIAPVSAWNGRWEHYLGADRSRIEPIINGVDPTRFAPQPMPDPDIPTIVWVGRIDPLKDLLTLIEAAGLIRYELPNAQILLFGKTPAGNEAYERACRERIAALGLESTVIFKGFARSPQDAFAQGHISVLSSISEALPFSVIEALFCGRPVVGTAVGGVPEVLTEGGRVVPPRSPADLAQACVELLSDMEGCRALGERAREHAMGSFTLSRFTDAYRELYQRFSAQPAAWGPLTPPTAVTARWPAALRAAPKNTSSS